MKFLLTALAGVSVASTKTQLPETWYSTIYLNESLTTSQEIAYGSQAVTPVPTSTAPLVLSTSYLSAPVASRNINHTTYSTVSETLPLTTVTPSVYITRPSLPTVTLNSTTTITTYLSTTIATVTLSSLVLPNGSPPASTATVYTGTYHPAPGQVIPSGSTQTAWPTAVTVHDSITATYLIYTYTGSTSTTTSVWTDTVYRTTTTASTTTTIEILPCIGRPPARTCTQTAYTSTATHTIADAGLAYVNATRTVPNTNTPTVTYAARCAPTNLLSVRDGHGLAVELSPDDFTFPIGFPGIVIGIPPSLVADPSACCQLCLDNEGCAASEWTLGWDTACRLFYHVPEIGDDGAEGGSGGGGQQGKKDQLCGKRGKGGGGGNGVVPVKYYADVYALPGQGSFIQVGCGSLQYLGLMDPFCPSCEVG
ncbi:hypothetical protein B0J18DRAFT_437462, partial [Chaetomium sp. MPI-SDFR-AT-0129]